ncbi:MAG: M16 family metallopeptidase, partial [Sciscionella sp.]
MHDYPVAEHRLENGLRVVVSTDHAVPAVAVQLWYDVGARHERANRTGLAHLFEHLMFQGSTNVAPVEHFSLLQAAGATLNGTTGFDRTNYYETVPLGALDMALWLEADRMGGLLDALTQAGLDNQREVVKNERRQRYDNLPYGTAWERLFAALFSPAHPYHHMPIGSMRHLDEVTLSDCREFFRTYYAPGNAVLAIVGDVEPEDALARVQRYFRAIPPGPAVPAAVDGSVGPARGEVRQEITEDVPSDAVYYAYRLPVEGSDGIEAADLAIRVLGEGASSRLTRRLVRRDQLAQSVSFSAMRLIGGVSVGTVVARAAQDVDAARLAEVADEEIAEVAAHGVTAAELERAKAQF